MSLRVDLSPAEEEELSIVAGRAGLAPEEFVRKLIGEHLPTQAIMGDDAVHAKLTLWQAQDGTRLMPDVPAHTLFARWAEEDTQMTDQERAAEDRLWQDFEQGINATRDALGMRQL